MTDNTLIKFIIILFFFSFISCSDKEKMNDLKELNINGHVSSIKKSTYQAVEKFGEVQKGERINRFWMEDGNNYSYSFNELGNITEIIEYKSDNEIDSKKVITYNENKKSERNDYNAEGELDGRVKYTYDKESNTTTINYYKSDGSLKNQYKDKYDGKKLVERRQYDDNGKLIIVVEYEFDKNDNPIRLTVVDEKGSVKQYQEGKYDQKGNRIEKKEYRDKKLLNDYKFVYDKNNNLLEETNSTASSKIKYEYNNHGDVIKETHYKSFDSLDYKIEFRIEYDDKNNWVKKISFENNKPSYYNEREVEYFK